MGDEPVSVAVDPLEAYLRWILVLHDLEVREDGDSAAADAARDASAEPWERLSSWQRGVVGGFSALLLNHVKTEFELDAFRGALRLSLE